MGDPATAMRDPIFYRWHAFVDDIFQEHKNVLNRYQVNEVRQHFRGDTLHASSSPPSLRPHINLNLFLNTSVTDQFHKLQFINMNFKLPFQSVFLKTVKDIEKLNIANLLYS